MACPNHPNKAYVHQEGKLVCPICGLSSPYQPARSYAELEMRVIQLERFLQDFAEYGDHEADFRRAAKRLLR